MTSSNIHGKEPPRGHEDVAQQMREFLSTKEVSEMTGVAPGTLRYWRHLGIGPASWTLGRKRVVYKRADLDRWLAEQEATTVRGDLAEASPDPVNSDSTRSLRQEVPGAAASTTRTTTKEAERAQA